MPGQPLARAQPGPVIRIGYWPVAAGLPFYAAIFVALMLVAYVPWFSMALPTLFGAV